MHADGNEMCETNRRDLQGTENFYNPEAPSLYCCNYGDSGNVLLNTSPLFL